MKTKRLLASVLSVLLVFPCVPVSAADTDDKEYITANEAYLVELKSQIDKCSDEDIVTIVVTWSSETVISDHILPESKVIIKGETFNPTNPCKMTLEAPKSEVTEYLKLYETSDVFLDFVFMGVKKEETDPKEKTLAEVKEFVDSLTEGEEFGINITIDRNIPKEEVLLPESEIIAVLFEKIPNADKLVVIKTTKKEEVQKYVEIYLNTDSIVSLYLSSPEENHTQASKREYGDIDGNESVDLSDLTMMSQYLLKDIELTADKIKCADVNADNEINLQDLALLKQYVMNDNVKLGVSKSEENTSVTLVGIVDASLRDGIPISPAEELFYADDQYIYLFGSIVSMHIECTFSDGTTRKFMDCLKEGTVSVSDLDKYDIYYIKKEVKPEAPVIAANNDEERESYIAEHKFASYTIDIDKDGTDEECTLAVGPTSGFFTVIISVYSDNAVKYRNIYKFGYKCDITIEEKDGEYYLKRTMSENSAVYNKMHIEDSCIVLDDLSEHDFIRGGPEYNKNVTLTGIVDIAERDGRPTVTMLEEFYTDGKYTYAFPSVKSDGIFCSFSDGSGADIRYALEHGLVSIEDLKTYDIMYWIIDSEGNMISSRD